MGRKKAKIRGKLRFQGNFSHAERLNDVQGRILPGAPKRGWQRGEGGRD